MFVKLDKRYKYFFIGVIVGSLTWAVSIYLYWSLNNESDVRKSQPISKERKKWTLISNEVVIPYEEDDRKRQRSKQKYYLEPNSIKNVDYIRQKLHPVPAKPIKGVDFGEVGQVKTLEDLHYRDEGYRLHGFNALISKNLDYHRVIPDTRNKLCRSQHYPSVLPNASIIICFYNEHVDTLIRTLHSILDRTPKDILHEIILVNDFSDVTGLHDSVKLYIKSNLTSKVKLFSTKKREGLIRARIFGADLATGDILVFLDSHVEVNIMWLEPLITRISQNSTSVVTPIIDIINADTFEYSASPIVRGGFNWGLHFQWVNVPIGTLNSEEDFVKPITSPTMAGGLFAIERDYFVKLGKYDPGMNIWGGENIELSFRIWLCGGTIEIIPCSRVGHVFRKRRPYGSPDGEDTMLRNSLRAAHVWMDDYIEYFTKKNESKHISYGDIADRLKLKKKLGCKPFSWYLKNVYPDLALPTDLKEVAQKKAQSMYQSHQMRNNNYIGHYQIRLSRTNLCIASEKGVKAKGSRLILKTCLRVKNQLWSETEKGEFRLAQYLCLDAEKQEPTLAKCHEMGGTQEWKHKYSSKMPIYNLAAGTCLSVTELKINAHVILDLCSSNESSQWDLVPVPN